MTKRLSPRWATTLALQFGHGLSTVDDALPHPQRRFADQLQFGHGLSTVDDCTSAGVQGTAPGRFNSATASRPWMTTFLWVPWVLLLGFKLQFGHGLSTVDDAA